MTNGIKEKELLAFLKAVEEGTVLLEPEDDPQYLYATNVSYKASNGWQITIFNDCNEWDYIDYVITADGRSVDFDGIDDHMPEARAYAPTDEVAWLRYGIPGHCKFRCTRCGAFLESSGLLQLPLVCGPCKALRKAVRLRSLAVVNDHLQAILLPILSKPPGEQSKRKTYLLAQWGICVYVYSLIAHLERILAGLVKLAEADNAAAAVPACKQVFEWAALTHSLTVTWRDRFRQGGWEQTWRLYGNQYAGDPPRRLPIDVPDGADLTKAIEEYERYRASKSKDVEERDSRSLIFDQEHANTACLMPYHQYEDRATIVLFVDPRLGPEQKSFLPLLNSCLLDLLTFMCELLDIADEVTVRPKVEEALKEVERLAPSLRLNRKITG